MQKRDILILFVLVLLGLGLGYASLTTNLNITGTTILKDNRWDIHLENIWVEPRSVTATTPTINTNRDTVTYSVTLNQPGDFYEFYVDCKNDGSIAGMISNVSSTLNNNPITNLPTALSYSLTYDDDIAINNNHLLPAGGKVTYKIRVAYRTDITASDLPSTETTLNFAFTVTYIQADNSAIPKPEPRAVYTVTSDYTYVGAPISLFTTYNTFNDVITASNHPIFLKLGVDENNTISSTYLGFYYNDTAYYIRGAGATYNSTISEWNNDGIYYERNKATLINAFGDDNCTEEVYYEFRRTYCSVPNMYVSAYNTGYTEEMDNTFICYIDVNEMAQCKSRDS